MVTLMADDPWTYEPTLQVAFGADLTASRADWPWDDLTARVRSRQWAIGAGRRSEGAQAAEPTSLTLRMDNGDGELTAGNPSSSVYGELVEGVPVRFGVAAGDPFLRIDGNVLSRARTPDDAALDITGDLAVAVTLQGPINVPYVPAGLSAVTRWHEVVGKVTTPSAWSWLLAIDYDGALGFRWSQSGTIRELAYSTLGLPRPDAGPLTIAVELDVDDGAGGHTVTFYALRGDIDTLLAGPSPHRLGDVYQGSGTTAVYSSTSPLDIGDNFAGYTPMRNDVREVRVLSGDLASGTEVANPDFTSVAVGTTSMTDSAGRTWSIDPTYAEVTNTRWRFAGQLSGQELTFPGEGQEEATEALWSLQGILGRLRYDDPLSSALRRFTTTEADDLASSTTVLAYWPAEDGAEAKVIASPIDGVPSGIPYGRLQPARDDTLPASQPLPSVGSGEAYGYSLAVPENDETTTWAATCLVKIPQLPASSHAAQVFKVNAERGSIAYWNVTVDDTPQMTVAAVGTDGIIKLLDMTSIDARMFQGWTVVSLKVDQNGADIDWSLFAQDVDDVALQANGTGTLSSHTCGAAERLSVTASATAPEAGISYGHWLVTADGTSSDHGLYIDGNLDPKPAVRAYVDEPAAMRVWRLAYEEGVDVAIDGVYTRFKADISATGSWVPMGPQLPRTFLELVEECALAENAILAESRGELALTYRQSGELLNQAPAVTVDGQLRAGGFTVVTDDRDTVNDVNVTRQLGSSYRAVDEANVERTGRRRNPRTVNVASELQLPNQAQWWLHEATWPDPRYPFPTFDLTKSSDLLEQWLDTCLGDVVSITGLPATHWPATVLQLAQGYTETVSPFGWLLQAQGGPEGPWQVGVRDDDDLGIRDTAGSRLSAGASSSTTSLSVETTLGPLWTTAGADAPWDIDVGGERMTVTAVSGTTSPQTFTVTRSVNGVTKAHAILSEVKLWRPARRALIGDRHHA